MTLVTGKSLVPAFDLKRILIVVEVLPKAIHTVMTFQAGCAIGQPVCCHVCDIHLTVTGITGIEIKAGDIVSVAILAGKWLTRRG